MLLNKRIYNYFSYFLLLLILHFNLRVKLFLTIVGLKPMTFKMVASLANHYTNVRHIEWEKTYISLPMGFMIWLKIIDITCNI